MTGDGTLSIDVAGERLVLLAERAIHWPRRDTLLLADPHFGKAAAFRSEGVPVPAGTTEDTLLRLTASLARTQARRVVILGDFLHARAGRARGTLDAIATWRRAHEGVEVLLVRGNHDRGAGDPPPHTGVACSDAPLHDPPFALMHQPVEMHDAYALAGHLHPGVRLQGAGGLQARLPCYVFGARIAVLPAFGEFTGLALVDPVPSDRVFAVAGDAVVEVRADAG